MSSEVHSAGRVFWLFGLSGAGKSTLADHLAQSLRRRGIPVLSLDGDVLRAGLSSTLGYSTDDRTEHLRRAAEVARVGVRSSLCVVASFITPLESQRQMVAGIVGRDRLALIHIDTPLQVCAARDVKGLYAGARQGKVELMTGVASAFEAPGLVDLVFQTGGESIDTSGQRLLAYALQQLNLS